MVDLWRVGKEGSNCLKENQSSWGRRHKKGSSNVHNAGWKRSWWQSCCVQILLPPRNIVFWLSGYIVTVYFILSGLSGLRHKPGANLIFVSPASSLWPGWDQPSENLLLNGAALPMQVRFRKLLKWPPHPPPPFCDSVRELPHVSEKIEVLQLIQEEACMWACLSWMFLAARNTLILMSYGVFEGLNANACKVLKKI